MTTTTGSGARVRLTPEQRRTQLLELGVEMLSTLAIEDITIDQLAERAGISRGLVYHYFGNLVGFREAVIGHAVDRLVEATAPPAEGDPMQRMLASVGVYVDYVADNYAGYVSILRAAAGGTDTMRAIYDQARAVLTDRIFREDAQGEILTDSPGARLVVRGWSAMAEEMVVSWVDDDAGMTRDELVSLLSLSLPSLVGLLEP